MADGDLTYMGLIKSILVNASQNDAVTAPSSPFGIEGMPSAGLGGATNSFAQAQAAQPEEPVPAIFLGKGEATVPTGHPTSGETKTTKFDETEHPADLMEKFAKASPEEQRKMALLLSLGGYAGEGSFEKLIIESFDMTLGDTLDAYNKLLQEAATQYVIHGNKVTPEQLLRRGIAYKMPAGSGWDGSLENIGAALSNVGINVSGIDADEALEGTLDPEKKRKPFVGVRTETATNVSRDIMDPADAKALTRAMLQRELGRDPTEGEFEDFISAIQYAQKTNPTVSKVKNSYTYEKDKYAAGGSRMVDRRTTTTTSGGLTEAGVQDIALQKARQQPGWAEYQAAGIYAPALYEALGATVSGR